MTASVQPTQSSSCGGQWRHAQVIIDRQRGQQQNTIARLLIHGNAIWIQCCGPSPNTKIESGVTGKNAPVASQNSQTIKQMDVLLVDDGATTRWLIASSMMLIDWKSQLELYFETSLGWRADRINACARHIVILLGHRTNNGCQSNFGYVS